MTKQIHDKELGLILLRINPRAKHYTLKIIDGGVVAIMPVNGNESKMLAFIESQRTKLRMALEKHISRNPLLDDTTEMQTNTFKLHIFRTDRDNFYMRLNKGILHIACPDKTDFSREQVQKLLKSSIEKALRHEAKRILPERLQILAKQHGFKYSSVKIHNSKSRWGSCSSKGNINLSLSLMLVPDHLIDYVLLHELCHTVEMNHSERFWKLLNGVTGNKALALRKELKGYKVL